MTTTAHPSGHTKAQYSFAQIPSSNLPRSVLNRSCGLKTAFDSGLLIPIFCDEALPNDTLNLNMSALVRLTTQTVAWMDNVYLDTFFFAVPKRLLWDNWQRFNGEQTDPGDSTVFLTPQMTESPADESLSDYLGIPTGNSLTFNSFWHRAYNLIYNEWFRDENLVDSVVVDTDDGPDDPLDYVLLRRGKRHDYLTSCLPFVQKGTAISLPLGQVVSSGDGLPTFNVVGGAPGTPSGLAGDTTTPMNVFGTATYTGTPPFPLSWNDPKLEATAATINEIREAFQIQKLLEKDARGGTRYVEILRSHFGITNHPDARLQRPEYLGGGSARVTVNPLAATSGAAGARVPGDLAAFAVGSSVGHGFVKSFVEHCVIIGLANVRADLTYQNGLNRMFSRRSRYDYYWPSFAHLGEQAVLNKEIFADGSANDDLTWGYQERWAEYRYKPSMVTGKMRSQASSSLDVWHLGLKFTSLPTLNDVFIADDPPLDRVVVTTLEPHWKADFYFQYRCARPMPTYSVPGLVDHF